MRSLLRSLCGLALLTVVQAASAGEWACLGDTGARRVLSFQGRIERDEDEHFYRAFAACFPPQYAGQRTLFLHSGGGAVRAALGISNWLLVEGARGRPIATQVNRGAFCISACTYLFVAGQLRDLATGGSFEPHGFSSFKGSRIDQAIAQVRDKSTGTVDWPKVGVQTARLGTLYQVFKVFGAEDARFAWVSEWTKGFADPQGRYRNGDDVRAAQAFLALSDAQKDFAKTVDGVVAVVVPEIERVAALEAFGHVLQSAGARVPTASGEQLSYYVDWMLKAFDAAAQRYVRQAKEGERKVVMGESVRMAVQETLEQRIQSTARAVATELGPYLLKRADQIDVPGFVQLMFSTSILYTRPVTREELCDLNIVNRDCAN